MSAVVQVCLRCQFVVTAGGRTGRRIVPVLRRQKEKFTESHKREENSASKCRRDIEESTEI